MSNKLWATHGGIYSPVNNHCQHVSLVYFCRLTSIYTFWMTKMRQGRRVADGRLECSERRRVGVRLDVSGTFWKSIGQRQDVREASRSAPPPHPISPQGMDNRAYCFKCDAANENDATNFSIRYIYLGMTCRGWRRISCGYGCGGLDSSLQLARTTLEPVVGTKLGTFVCNGPRHLSRS